MSFHKIASEAIIILVLILLNGIFSASEIAIIAARRGLLEKMEKDGSKSAGAARELKDSPERFLATVQIGVTVVGTLASVIGGVISIELLRPVLNTVPIGFVRSFSEPLSIGIVVTIIAYAMLILGELSPKSLALRFPEKTACFTAIPMQLLARASSFIVTLITSSTTFVLRLIGIKGLVEKVFVSEEEIKYLIREGRVKGIFEETEGALLQGVFEFADTTVAEVMVPRPKINGVELKSDPDKVLGFIVETGFSRYPVYRDNMENIVGILYAKDVFRVLEEKRPIDIGSLVREPYFIPDSIMISRLLREMQKKRVHMAIVADEHGDVDGLVTIEDLLEEIVGEIEDEFDLNKNGIIELLKDGTMVIEGSATLRDLCEAGLPFKEDEERQFNTIAGLLLSSLQRIPKGGESVIYKGNRFTIAAMEGRRITKVRVERQIT